MTHAGGSGKQSGYAGHQRDKAHRALLKAAILKYLASRKEKKLAKARAAPEKPTGKQTVKQLIGQNQASPI